MSATPTSAVAAPVTHAIPGVGEILRRTAMPLCLFCAVILSFLLLSWVALLPTVTSVEIGGERRSSAELREYAASLRAQITAQEGERDAFVLPMHDTSYRSMIDAKLEQPSALMLLAAVEEEARSLADAPDAVHIERAHYDALARILHLRGDVRNVGPRSMTVLAQFVETLRDMPHVASLTTPKFVREEDPVIGFHSPFTLSVHLE